MKVNAIQAGLTRLRPVEVVIARVDGDEPFDEASAFAVLDVEERARAARFRHDADRMRFVIAHALLRRVAARWLMVDPGAVPVTRLASGAPLLSGHRLHVSLTHSGDVAACAVSVRRIGVDIERDDADVTAPELVRRFCAASELRALDSLPPLDRSRLLLRIWVRKEALGKALGAGLNLPLASIDVLRTRPRTRYAEARRMRLYDVDAGPGYVGAVAAEHALRRPRINQVPPAP